MRPFNGKRQRVTLILAFAALLAPVHTVGGAAQDPIEVEIQPKFFNPTLGQAVTIRVHGLASQATLIELIDRDGYVVRVLPPGENEQINGHESYITNWDGKDDVGDIVPNEVYGLRISHESPSGEARVYVDPGAERQRALVSITDVLYSRQKGVLSYELPVASRVHAVAGEMRPGSGSRRFNGPVLKTIVDRQPRTNGSVVETWNGRDESGAVYVPDLPGFVVSVVAEPVFEHSIIAIGNRSESFPEYVQRRSRHNPQSFAERRGTSRLHADLDSLEDRSPKLLVTPVRGLNRAGPHRWIVEGEVELRVEVEDMVASRFLAQPTHLRTFVDSEEISALDTPRDPARVVIPTEFFRSGKHRIVLNWVSDRGPIGVGVLSVETPRKNEITETDQ